MKLLLIAPLLIGATTDHEETVNTYEVYDRLMEFGETTKSLDIHFTRTVYDHTFETVTYSKGRLYWESSAHWTFYEEPVEHPAQTQRVRERDYTISTAQSICWLRDGNELSEINYAVGKREIWFREEPDETGIASTIRSMAAIPQMADFNPYAMTSQMKDGKVRVDLEPTRPIYGTTVLGRSYTQHKPEISMLLDADTMRPTTIRMTDNRESTFVIQSEVRNVVPADRDEILFPCPWLFEADAAPPVRQTSEDYRMTFDLLVGVIRLLAPGL